MKKWFVIVLFLFSTIFIQSCNRRTIIEEVDPIVAEHVLFDPGISSLLRVVGYPSFRSEDDDFLTMRYSLTTITRIRQGLSRQIDYYQFDWLFEDGSIGQYYNLVENELRQEPLRTLLQNFLPFAYHNQEHITGVRGRILYSYLLNEALLENEYIFEELFLTIDSTNLTPFIRNAQSSLFTYRIEITNNLLEDVYRLKIHIDFANNQEPYHFDMQSWIKTIDGAFYPLLGIYNFTELNSNYETITDIFLLKVIPIDSLYFSFLYYDSLGNPTEQYAYVMFEDLMDSFDNL